MKSRGNSIPNDLFYLRSIYLHPFFLDMSNRPYIDIIQQSWLLWGKSAKLLSFCSSEREKGLAQGERSAFIQQEESSHPS
jgi:hypothetical protein